MSGRVVTLKTKNRTRVRKPGGVARRRSPTSCRSCASASRRQDIAPGAKLREQELADEFGVPRARIREVFGALESRGLIERIPNRGAVVSRLELDQVFQLYDVRAVLEGLCVRLATQNAPPETWQEFVELFGAPMDGFVQGRRLRLLHRRATSASAAASSSARAIPWPRRCSTASTRRPTW